MFYFLHSSVEGGVRFGLLGFCTELADVCSPKKYVLSPSVVLSHQLLSHCTRFGYQFAWGGVDILITPLPMILLLYPVGTSNFYIYKWVFGTDPYLFCHSCGFCVARHTLPTTVVFLPATGPTMGTTMAVCGLRLPLHASFSILRGRVWRYNVALHGRKRPSPCARFRGLVWAIGASLRVPLPHVILTILSVDLY